jgi:hypothetical protein
MRCHPQNERRKVIENAPRRTLKRIRNMGERQPQNKREGRTGQTFCLTGNNKYELNSI